MKHQQIKLTVLCFTLDFHFYVLWVDRMFPLTYQPSFHYELILTSPFWKKKIISHRWHHTLLCPPLSSNLTSIYHVVFFIFLPFYFLLVSCVPQLWLPLPYLRLLFSFLGSLFPFFLFTTSFHKSDLLALRDLLKLLRRKRPSLI